MKNLIDKIHINLLNLLFPAYCCGCKSLLLRNQKILCLNCLHDISLNQPTDNQTKEMQQLLDNYSLKFGYYQLTFSKNGIVQQIIHNLKYKSRQDVGVFLAEMYLPFLAETNKIETLDFVIPVPIHKKRKAERGYNQMETYGKTIANYFNIEYNDKLLIRKKYAKSSTGLNKEKRANQIKDSFAIDNFNSFQNKHILLIDDVFTTGATLKECLHELNKIPNAKFSILSISYNK